ncbi:MAG: TlyA family RNA methyltransferase [Acidimicrobiia bacterium]|nr:TlyA family RNA methyltransferase [Acidimicrobiia bacterium]
MSSTRLDQEIVARRLVPSRSGARRAIREGQVTVDGTMVRRPAYRVAVGSDIAVDPAATRWASRGGHKLAAALDEFAIEVQGRSAIDIGASTGGFTDVLLKRGATRVVALDVGHGQLAGSLRSDPRCDVYEGLDVRDAKPQQLGAPFDVVVVDLSFISLTKVADTIRGLGGEDSDWVGLVKPQFEVGPGAVGKDGVVKALEARGQSVVSVAQAFAEVGLVTRGAIASPITGSSGNREALLWLRRTGIAVGRTQLFKVLEDE